ncbi:unnamed protein product, partial [Brassica napus]
MMIFTVLSGYCSARVYKVGDSEGWTAKDECVLGQKLEVLVIHDPLRPVPLPTPSKFLSVGKTYKVRVSEGWKVYDNDFYNKWSEEKQFHVGDSLIFEYTNEVNDFYEINGDLEFMTCDPTSPVAVHKT